MIKFFIFKTRPTDIFTWFSYDTTANISCFCLTNCCDEHQHQIQLHPIPINQKVILLSVLQSPQQANPRNPSESINRLLAARHLSQSRLSGRNRDNFDLFRAVPRTHSRMSPRTSIVCFFFLRLYRRRIESETGNSIANARNSIFRGRLFLYGRREIEFRSSDGILYTRSISLGSSSRLLFF